MIARAEKARMVLQGFLPFAVALAILAALQRVLPPVATNIFVNAGVNVVLAVSLNVVNGFTGQFSLGHAGFMAVGAYTSARITLAMADVQLAFLPEVVSDQVVFAAALLASMVVAGLAGLLVGAPSLRLRGDYLAIVTLGFGEIIRSIIENVAWLGGALGLSGLPRRTNVVWVGLSAVATVIMARRLAGSTQGRALFAIREDEVAAEAMGVDTTGYKVRAFAISAAYAGLAGALSAHLIQLATPGSFTFIRSMEVVVMVVLGGLGSITGCVITAVVITVGLEQLREFEQYRMVVYALLLIAVMLARPQGLLGTRELWDLWRRRPPAGKPPLSPTGGEGRGEGAVS